MSAAGTGMGAAGGLPPVGDLKSQVDLRRVVANYGVDLEKEGREFVGLCPFHQESGPSFKVYSKDGEQRFKCFGCEASGDVLDFIQRIENATFPNALARLAELAGRPLEEPKPKPRGDTGRPRKGPGREIEHYDYTDAAGKLLYRVVRHEAIDRKDRKVILRSNGKPDKCFTQRRPDGNGGWVNNLDGVERVLYRLPDVLAASEVWLCEGEKDAHAVAKLGVVATTASQGANSPWLQAYTETLRGKSVLVVPDTDKPGQERGARVAMALHGNAASVRILGLPVGLDDIKDVSDYIDVAGVTDAEELRSLAVPFEPATPPEPTPPATESSPAGKHKRAAAEPGIPDNQAYHDGYSNDWRMHLHVNREHNPRPVLVNAIAALECCPIWKDVLAYNEFAVSVVAVKGSKLPWNDKPLAADLKWTDQEDRQFSVWLQQNGIYVTPHIAGEAAQTHGRKKCFHPVREFLQGLDWDGNPRIDSWLVRYLGVEASDLTTAIGACWLISAVARVMRPGCQADHALILEGPQGLRKSTAMRVLGEPWFTDEISDIGSKDAAMQTHGVWIIEMSELGGIHKATEDTLKAFISRRMDHYRPPYGKHVVDCPRQCVFAMTVNPDASGTYRVFSDPTGGRRFWPVRCTTVDLDALVLDRNQLWAEAYARFHDGAAWWLEDRQLIQAAEHEQEERFTSDPWESIITGWLTNPTQRYITERGTMMPVEPFTSARNAVTVADILAHGIGKSTKDWSRADEMRIARILTRAGWERFRLPRDEDGDRGPWAYRPKQD